jgi:hypothetical protein|eukprot:SAG25_NODE_341_length_9456_cov_13.967938_8_plen_48_part_00
MEAKEAVGVQHGKVNWEDIQLVRLQLQAHSKVDITRARAAPHGRCRS